MKRVGVALVALSLVAMPGCKIVHESEMVAEIPAGPEGDAARNAARLEETFETQLLPRIRTSAVTVAALRSALDGGLDAAGAAHGNQGSGRGAAWNFALGDQGAILEAKLDTSARTVTVDVNGDGAADVTVQLGPVIRGTALRDVAPFYNFDDFRDQIEFAKLARAINDRIKPTLVVPEGDLTGRTLRFLGVVPLKKTTDKFVVTPVEIAFE